MAPAELSAFGVLLRRLRVEAGLTQEGLAERARVSARVVSDLERGVTQSPHLHTVRQLADALALVGEEREAFQRAARQIGEPHLRPEEGKPPASLPPPEQMRAIRPTKLPDEATPFIGREKEMAALSQLLRQPEIRLVTLTGPGGSGKTRLALEVARAHLSSFKDGVFLVSLAPLATPDLVAPTIAIALGIAVAEEQSLIDALIRSLQDKSLLLVLDNFEHLLVASPLVGDLVRSCPSVRILITSRAVLHLSMEHGFPIPPLALPELHQQVDLEALSRSNAVAFFVDRAQAARPDFVLTGDNASYVAAICHRLDGLPLALELAATRIRLFPPQALLTRLERSLELLTGGALDHPTRQQTLRATMDWSYSLLSLPEQTLFAQLSVFAGGCTLDAAEVVCQVDGDPPIAVLDGLASLVEKSLLRQEGEHEPRLGMLETIREYAAEKLAHSDTALSMRAAHARYVLALAQRAAPELRGAGMAAWLERLTRETDNIRAALRWLYNQGEFDTALELVVALTDYWTGSGHLAEGLNWLQTLLDAYEEATSLRTRALDSTAVLAFRHGDYEAAHRLTEVALRLARADGDERRIGKALLSVARLLLARRDTDAVLQVSEEGIVIGQRIGDPDLLANHLLLRAEAMRLLQRHAEARSLYQQSLEACGQRGRAELFVSNLHNLLQIELDEGNLDRAQDLLRQKVEAARPLHNVWLDAYTLLTCARLAAGQANLAAAVRLLAAAALLFERIGVRIEPLEQPGYDVTLSVLRHMVPDVEFTRLWQEGQAMSLDLVMTYALGETGVSS